MFDQEEKNWVGLSRPELRLCLILVLRGCLFRKGSGYFRHTVHTDQLNEAQMITCTKGGSITAQEVKIITPKIRLH